MHYTAISGIYTVTRQSKSHCDLCYAYPPHIPDICTVFCQFMLLSATPDCTYTRFSPPDHITMTGHGEVSEEGQVRQVCQKLADLERGPAIGEVSEEGQVCQVC